MKTFKWKPKVISRCCILLSFTLLFIAPSPSSSEESVDQVIKPDDQLEEELKYLKEETYVITASRILENIKKAPGSITVVTDKQIRQMGARDLVDVLKTVPGMSYFYYNWGGWYLQAARGVGNVHNCVFQIMINGHSINETLTGGGPDNLIIDNAERIEIVRGPGSALYGANAFAGVINVITKEADDIDGLELKAIGGSYDTHQYNVLFGKKFKGLETSFNFNFFKTHGYDGTIESDKATQRDEIFGTSASYAPGEMESDDKKYDAQLTLKYKGFKFDGRYIDRDRQMPLMGGQLLSNNTYNFLKRYYLNFSYEKELLENLDFKGKIYRNSYERVWQREFWPEGTVWYLASGYEPLTENWMGIPSFKSHRTGIEFQTDYKIVASNTIVVGATFEKQKLSESDYQSNMLLTEDGFVMLDEIGDLPYSWVTPAKRDFWALFAEDLWDITEDLRLTIGARYDHYSDFGGSFNPRVGLNWEFTRGYVLKLLYGRAFRAPSFYELYSLTGGNSELKPETVDTYEIGIRTNVTMALSGQLTFFYNHWKDVIIYKPVPGDESGIWKYNNYEERKRPGVEFELKYDFGRGTYLSGNYTYVNSTSGAIPTHTGTVMANVRLSRYLNFNTYCLFRYGFTRIEGDDRDDYSGDAIVNATLIARNFLNVLPGFELRGSVYNLFNTDYIMTNQDGYVPDDYPMPGLTVMVEARYKF